MKSYHDQGDYKLCQPNKEYRLKDDRLKIIRNLNKTINTTRHVFAYHNDMFLNVSAYIYSLCFIVL